MSSWSDGNAELGPGLLASIGRYWWMVLLVTLAGASLGFGYAASQPTLYAASTTLLLADPRTQTVLAEPRNAADPSRYVRNQAQVVTSAPVINRAAQILERDGQGGPVVVTAEPAQDVDTIRVRAFDERPERAALVADVVAVAYEQVRTEQNQASTTAALAELARARADVEAQLTAIEETLRANPEDPAAGAARDAAAQQLQVLATRSQQLIVDTAVLGGGVQLRDPAFVPTSPVEPRPLRTAGAAALLSFVVASATAWWWRTRKSSARGVVRTEALVGAPLLADVPHFNQDTSPFPAISSPRSPAAESYRFLAIALTHAMRRLGGRTLLVTGPAMGPGTTATAVNLAAACSREGRQIVLVDADTRTGDLIRRTGASPEFGLYLLVEDEVPLGACVDAVRVPGLEGLLVASVLGRDGPEPPRSFLGTSAFRRALERLQEMADLVIVDSPPLLGVADAFEMAAQVDAVLVVVNPGTTDETLVEMKRRLDLAGATVVGFVLNRSDSRHHRHRASGHQASHRLPGALTVGAKSGHTERVPEMEGAWASAQRSGRRADGSRSRSAEGLS